MRFEHENASGLVKSGRLVYVCIHRRVEVEFNLFKLTCKTIRRIGRKYKFKELIRG
jgi:hypothetical protein